MKSNELFEKQTVCLFKKERKRDFNMVLRQIYALYFSPTGGTEKIVSSIADTLSRLLELPVHSIDFTYLENRQKEYHFPNDSLVIIGTPVYAGRIPNKILPDFKKCIVGAGHTPVIPVCVYGNRNYDVHCVNCCFYQKRMDVFLWLRLQ